MTSSGLEQWRQLNQISPIYLTGGIAANVSGGTVALLNYTQGNAFNGLTSGAGQVSLDDYFAYFEPVTGATLISNAIGAYPFANQATAANAIITQPLAISMMMICPAKNWSQKQATIMALQQTLAQHNNAGGTYSVQTPSFLWTDLIMTGMHDASGGETRQPQYRWQLDFAKPLITLAEAQQAQNSLMGKISSGTQVSASATGEVSTSSAENVVGNPAAGAAATVVPATAPNVGLSSNAGSNVGIGASGSGTFSFATGTSDFSGAVPGL